MISFETKANLEARLTDHIAQYLAAAISEKVMPLFYYLEAAHLVAFTEC